MKRLGWQIFLAAVVVASLSGSASAAPSDMWTTTKAKIAVLTEVGTGTSVNVDTVDGVVTLHGTVASEDDKKRAEKAVRDLDGVKKVRNLLQVVAAEKQDAVAREDATIKNDVVKELKAETELSDSDIGVQSVNDGTVLLAGQAKSASDHLRAIQVARGVRGVIAVHSEIKSPDPSKDDELHASAEGVKKEGKGMLDRATGKMSDAWITSATKARLLADDKTPGMEINVDTQDGIVTLFGTVPSKEAKSAAEAEAKKVSGVKRVDNRLVVSQAATNEADTE